MLSQFLILCLPLTLLYASEIINSKNGPSFYIYGADDAPEAYAPFACSIQRGGHHHSGCAIISKIWAITAAESVVNRIPSEFEIMVGSNEILGQLNATRYQLEKIIIHENFEIYKNNIAVIKLRGNGLNLSKTVKPIEISREEVLPGTEIEIYGWGIMGNSYQNPTRLQLSKVKSSSTEICGKHHPYVDESNFCSLYKDFEYACKGDEGSPVILRSHNDSSQILFGIIINPFCGHADRPNLMAKISYFYSWIESKTDV